MSRVRKCQKEIVLFEVTVYVFSNPKTTHGGAHRRNTLTWVTCLLPSRSEETEPQSVSFRLMGDTTLAPYITLGSLMGAVS